MNNLHQLMALNDQSNELQKIAECNELSQKYGLTLTDEDIQGLLVIRQECLKTNGRIEFDGGVVTNFIYEFCDSQYIYQGNYVEILGRLQELFYLYKNEAEERLTDDELIEFMKKQFEGVCFGDLDYLEGTCLERFTRAVRSGYITDGNRGVADEHSLRKPGNEYSKLSEESRWDFELYKKTLENME